MLFLGRKNRLVNQAPLTAHTETHNLLMHYENHPEELPPLPPLKQPWEDKVRTHTSFQGALGSLCSSWAALLHLTKLRLEC